MNKIGQALRAASEAGEIPGVVAAAATADGVIFQTAHGRRVLPDGAPMTLDTVFRIASMTKAITATAAMQLVEQDKLALDAPAGEVLAELGAPQVLEGFDAAGEPRLRPARTPITLRRLLTHTAGFGYDTWNSDLLAYSRAREIPPARTGKLAALGMPLTFDPGTAWQYGINIDWVGRMVEAASGIDLETYFQNHICGPLGMPDTSFLVRPDMEARLATVHARCDGRLDPLPGTINPVREFFPGGGGLYSTAGDYLRFLRMLLGGGVLDGARVLAAETVALMGQNHMGALEVVPMRTAIPAASNDFEAFPGMPKKWGLSFLINTQPVPGGRSADSLAWAGLNNTYFWLDPHTGVAGVLMTQVLPFGDPMVLKLLEAFETSVYRSRNGG
ncbi:MAG: serine hydrolase domain-containing protein [Acetobacteraceae bacterium]